uniref:Uncharacterized protein n=1 Tax=Arundo donax TaxID=35708 RepID=A0A0A8ZR60_ARUDO
MQFLLSSRLPPP